MNQERAKAASPGGSEGSEESRRNKVGTIRLGRKAEASNENEPHDAVICPVCKTRNPVSESFCGECGFLLKSKLEDFAALLPTVEDMAKSPRLEDANGRSYPLRPGVNTFGRENTDILIVDRSISRYHGMIVFDEERDLFSVEDSGSTNGTRVNGEPLLPHKPRAIRPGDELTFGNILLRFIAEGEAQVVAGLSTPSEPVEATLPNASGYDPLLTEPSAHLELLRGNGPREILIGQGVTTIGRNPDNKICLSEDRYISGHHSKIEADGELFLLLDLGSTNGTYLNGIRLTTNTAIAISDGDEILIGGLLFQFHKMTVPIRTDPALERTLVGSGPMDDAQTSTESQ